MYSPGFSLNGDKCLSTVQIQYKNWFIFIYHFFCYTQQHQYGQLQLQFIITSYLRISVNCIQLESSLD